jgi:nucleoside-diphosphate-sugar epimerase
MPVRQVESKLTSPTKFVLIGSGSLGQHIVEELLKKNLSVRILSRDVSRRESSALTEYANYFIAI